VRGRHENYEGQSKTRLLENITKKFNTTTIGSLAVFEDIFGYLWGHGIEYKKLSKSEKKWRKVWSEARTEILDLGNSNLRGAQNEIGSYTISWDRYITDFYFKEDEE